MSGRQDKMSDRVGYRTSVAQTVTEPVLTDCYQSLYETQFQLNTTYTVTHELYRAQSFIKS
jgi:hypothetical protein